jgi:hypothetical protein
MRSTDLLIDLKGVERRYELRSEVQRLKLEAEYPYSDTQKLLNSADYNESMRL